MEAPVDERADPTVLADDVLHHSLLKGMRLAFCLGEAHVAQAALNNVGAALAVELVVVEDIDHRDVHDVQDEEEEDKAQLDHVERADARAEDGEEVVRLPPTE